MDFSSEPSSHTLVHEPSVVLHFVVDFLQFSKTDKCGKVCVCLAQCFLCIERYTLRAWSYCCEDQEKKEATLYTLSELNAPHFLCCTVWFISPCAYHATCSGHKTQPCFAKSVFPKQINAKAIKSEFEDAVQNSLNLNLHLWCVLYMSAAVKEVESGLEGYSGEIGLQSVWDYENRQRCSPWPLMANKTTPLKPTYIQANYLFHA